MLIQEYQDSWADDFGEIKKIIHTALSATGVAVFHIGSTSVPNLAAKPIIDIDIVYDSNIDFEEIKSGLEKLGYIHFCNQGIKDREVFKRQNSTQQHSILDSIQHHLYVCPVHSQELKRHLLFRNFLIQNEAARQQYQQIKIQIAEEALQDRKEYARLKELKAHSFIQSIIEKGEENSL